MKYVHTTANKHLNVHNSQGVEITQCPSTDRYRNKLWRVHTRENYLKKERERDNDVYYNKGEPQKHYAT